MRPQEKLDPPPGHHRREAGSSRDPGEGLLYAAPLQPPAKRSAHERRGGLRAAGNNFFPASSPA